MSRVVRSVVSLGASLIGAAIGFAIGGPLGAAIGSALFSVGAGLILGKPGGPRRSASAAQLQLGEQPRQAILGRAAVGGSLVDAFNYGGRYGTDWEVLVIALADHRCDALEGFFVDDTYVAFAGDGNVAGFNNQLQVFWRSGTWDQTVPSILTTNGPGWTANDRGRGVAYVVVAYKADKSDAKNPVWPSGRPRFRWVVRGLRCYQARKDSTVGGSGAHRRDNPATWEWTENPIDIRYNWVRGIYAGDLVDQPGMLLIGRGLSAIEAPPANVFARANLCDELVGGQPRYRVGGVVAANEPFIDVESDFAAAVAGTISQPEGAVEVDPGQAKAPVAHFTDDDLLIGSTVRWNEGILGQQDEGWVNTVAPRFVDPTQRWTVRSAPVQRDLADVTADGGPREQQPQLDFVTNGPQAQRIGQIIRRLGRLWGRGSVTLPPRFAFIEEGDWVTWQSDRRFGGATLTFRVRAWGSDAAWHHTLTLRQISASVYSDTAPLDDGSIASDQPEPPVVAAPGVGAWNAAAVLLGAGSVRIPNLRVAGATDDPAASFVVFEYIQQVAAPGVGSIWTFAASSRPEITLLDIPVPEGGTFWVAVSYVVDGIQGERRVLGPISTSGLSFSDGSPVAPVAPANANRVPLSRMEGNSGWVRGSSSPGSGSVSYSTVGGRRVATVSAVATAAEQFVQVSSAETGTQMSFPVRGGERLSISARVGASGAVSRWQINFGYRRADGAYLEAAVGSGLSTRSLDDPPFATFFTVPADAVVGAFLLFAVSNGAGSYEVAVSEPMVTSAAAGQTVHPPFTPGPVLTGPVEAGGPLLVGTLPPGRVEGDFGGNFIADPIFGEGWVYSNAGYSPGLSGGNLYDRHRAVFLGEGIIWFVGSGFPELERAAVTVGETYYFSGWFFRAASATGHITARVELYDATGANIGVEDIPGTSTVGMATNAWTRLLGQWTCPAGVAYVRPLVGNNTGGNTSTIFVGLPYFGRHQPGADVTADAQITFTAPPPFQIQADSAGITTTDLSTQTRSITLLRGGVAQTSGVTVGTPTGNPSAAITIASATVSGGIVTVTLATANASGSVTIPIIFGGVTSPVTIPVNRTIAPPPSGGSGDTLFNDGSWANINTTTYTQVTDSGATVRSTTGGQLSFGFSAQYNGGNVQCKAQYSLNGTTWSDVARTETTGTGAITVPGEEEPGSISRALVTQSSLAASTLYFVRLVARRTGGTGTISWIGPSFTARQP